jgi:hypothetical protein
MLLKPGLWFAIELVHDAYSTTEVLQDCSLVALQTCHATKQDGTCYDSYLVK